MNEYVIATFEPEDVVFRASQETLAYVKENGLMDEVVMRAVKWLRVWFDDFSGEPYYEALDYALEEVIGKDMLRELEG